MTEVANDPAYSGLCRQVAFTVRTYKGELQGVLHQMNPPPDVEAK